MKVTIAIQHYSLTLICFRDRVASPKTLTINLLLKVLASVCLVHSCPVYSVQHQGQIQKISFKRLFNFEGVLSLKLLQPQLSFCKQNLK